MGKAQRRIVSAWIGTAYAQEDATAAHAQWRTVADQLRPKVPKLATLIRGTTRDEAPQSALVKAGRELIETGALLMSSLGCHPRENPVTAVQRGAP